MTSRGPPPLIRLPTYPLPPGPDSLRLGRGRGPPGAGAGRERAWGGAGGAAPERRRAGSRSLLPAPVPVPFSSFSSQEIPAVSLRPAYSALGAARSWEGDRAGPPPPGPRGGKSDPGKLAAPPRRCPWHGGARRRPAPSPFLALPALSRRPATLPTVPRRLGRRRTPSAQGTAPGAPAGTGRLAGTFGKTAKPLGSLGSASVSFSTSQMHPPKSFPKPSAS